MKTILVTGGAGFAAATPARQYCVPVPPVTFDNLERGQERAVKWDRWSAAIRAITTTSNGPSQHIGRGR